MENANGFSVSDCSSCTKIIGASVDLETPLSVSGYVRLGEVETTCCKDPEIEIVQNCKGCRLVVKQNLAVRIPLYYSASVTAEESHGKCR